MTSYRLTTFSTVLVMISALILLFLVGFYSAWAANPGAPAPGTPPGPGIGPGPGPGPGPGTPPPSTYLSNLYLVFLAFVGIAALFGIVRGGLTYMFSGANPSLVGEAKRWIWNAIYGIVLAAASVLLLQTINPDLVTHGFNLENLIPK